MIRRGFDRGTKDVEFVWNEIVGSFLIDSGASGTIKQSVIGLLDQGTEKWGIVKAADNNLVFYDSVNAANRLFIDHSGDFGFNGNSFGGGTQVSFHCKRNSQSL